MEDEQIIDLYFRRSEQAIHETDHKYGHSCRKVSFNVLQNKEDSEECVNDTLRLLLRMPTVLKRCNVE